MQALAEVEGRKVGRRSDSQRLGAPLRFDPSHPSKVEAVLAEHASVPDRHAESQFTETARSRVDGFGHPDDSLVWIVCRSFLWAKTSDGSRCRRIVLKCKRGADGSRSEPATRMPNRL